MKGICKFLLFGSVIIKDQVVGNRVVVGRG